MTPPISLADAFRVALASIDIGVDLASRLGTACLDVLPIDGAGLTCAFGDRRTVLGASDAVAMTAEQMQVDLGDGPSVHVQQTRTAIVAATAIDLAGQWPTFADRLHERTPFQGVISIPISGPDGGSTSLTFYRIRPGTLAPGFLKTLTEVGGLVGGILTAGESD